MTTLRSMMERRSICVQLRTLHHCCNIHMYVICAYCTCGTQGLLVFVLYVCVCPVCVSHVQAVQSGTVVFVDNLKKNKKLW